MERAADSLALGFAPGQCVCPAEHTYVFGSDLGLHVSGMGESRGLGAAEVPWELGDTISWGLPEHYHGVSS